MSSVPIVVYVLISWAAKYVSGLFPILLLGPTKSLTFVLDGVSGLSQPRTNIPDANNYIWAGIIIHLVCWLVFPVIYIILLRYNPSVVRACLISAAVAWIIGIPVNWGWEVIRSI